MSEGWTDFLSLKAAASLQAERMCRGSPKISQLFTTNLFAVFVLKWVY